MTQHVSIEFKFSPQIVNLRETEVVFFSLPQGMDAEAVIGALSETSLAGVRLIVLPYGATVEALSSEDMEMLGYRRIVGAERETGEEAQEEDRRLSEPEGLRGVQAPGDEGPDSDPPF